MSEQFHTTQWSMIVAAGNDAQSGYADALAELCSRYWYPLYAHIRSRGYQDADAQDKTQAFFERLVEKGVVSSADRERGKFRSFLLASLQNFLANEYAKANAVKRGGANRTLSLDFRVADQRWQHEPASSGSVEDDFQRRWAMSVLDTVMSQLKEHYVKAGKQDLYTALSPYLVASNDTLPYAEVADQLEISIANVKVSVHRLRSRYREMLESEIASTLNDDTSVADEIADLFKALSTT